MCAGRTPWGIGERRRAAGYFSQHRKIKKVPFQIPRKSKKTILHNCEWYVRLSDMLYTCSDMCVYGERMANVVYVIGIVFGALCLSDKDSGKVCKALWALYMVFCALMLIPCLVE